MKDIVCFGLKVFRFRKRLLDWSGLKVHMNHMKVMGVDSKRDKGSYDSYEPYDKQEVSNV